MRVYFEKPRTATGWKGFINDPDLDDSFHIDKGMRRARELLLAFAELGLPAGSEALDPLSPQYLADLISWYAIGARTTESQTHREMASGLSTPVGFKNGTDGGLRGGAQRDALGAHRRTASSASAPTVAPRSCALAAIGWDTWSCAAAAEAELRHGQRAARRGGPRESESRRPTSSSTARTQLAEGSVAAAAGLHGLRAPDQGRQPLDRRIDAGKQPGGRQPADSAELAQLKYGVSVTDACIDWATTADLLRRAAGDLRPVLAQRPT